MEVESKIIYRALLWAERVTVIIDGTDVKVDVDRSKEICLLASHDPTKLQQRVVASIPTLILGTPRHKR